MSSFSAESVYGSPGRVALVTGASRGVGAAAVRLLASRGFSVVVNYAHDQELADRVVDSILGQGGAALAVRADVGDDVDVERLFAETVEWCGGVDVVVHAVVGAPPGGPLAELSVDQIDAWIQVEARARLLVNREAARYVRDGGAIVNLSSAPNGRTVPGLTARKASADADSLTKSLAAELRGRPVSVNAIALDLDGQCDPDPVAGIVAYLASDEGRRHTGQVMTVGQWLRDPRSNGDSPPR
jgi:3-oxoacyl-[acyl-carrier protein] reductase